MGIRRNGVRMKTKMIFFDIDGTLCDVDGTINLKTMEAVRRVKENGHKIFICTGRSKSEIYENVLQLQFDGIVGAAGAYVEIDNKIIFHRCMEKSETSEIVDIFDKNAIKFILETNECGYTNASSKAYIENILRSSNKTTDIEEYLGILKIKEDLKSIKNVNKILFYDSPCSIEALREKFKFKYNIIGSAFELLDDNGGELSAIDINKATGIDVVLNYFKAELNDTIAIGDGNNDLEMLQHVGLGIAMGNAVTQLKEVADYVTLDAKDDGIYHALLKYGLI